MTKKNLIVKCCRQEVDNIVRSVSEKKVTFNLTPTIHIIPSLTEEEKAQEQEERWAMLLESLQIGP